MNQRKEQTWIMDSGKNLSYNIQILWWMRCDDEHLSVIAAGEDPRYTSQSDHIAHTLELFKLLLLSYGTSYLSILAHVVTLLCSKEC